MDKRKTNSPKTALITGASAGIGRAIAEEHATHGGDLILVARSTTKLEKLKAEWGSKYEIKITIFPTDLSIAGAAEELFKKVIESGHEVEILINNAGFGDCGLFHETDIEKEEMMINLNVLALTQLTKLFGSEMVKRGHGKILNISSTAAFSPGPLMSVYFATKHYVQAFSESLDQEWRPLGIPVTTLCPGATATEFQAVADIQNSPMMKRAPVASAEEVAKFGYKQMNRGAGVVVHGLANTIVTKTSHLIPNKLLGKVSKRLFKRPEKK